MVSMTETVGGGGGGGEGEEERDHLSKQCRPECSRVKNFSFVVKDEEHMQYEMGQPPSV